MNPRIKTQNKSIVKKSISDDFGLPANNFTLLSSPGKQIVPHGSTPYEDKNITNWDFKDWTLESDQASDPSAFITGDNHDFEGSTGTWAANTGAGGTIVQSSGQAYEGTFSGKITYGTNFYVAYLSFTGLTANTLYELTAKVYNPSSNSNTSIDVITANLTGKVEKSKTVATADDQWAETKYVFKTATDINGSVSIYMPGGSTDDYMYIDKVEMKQVGSMGHYIFDKSYVREDRNSYIGTERGGSEVEETISSTWINNGAYPWSEFSVDGHSVVASDTEAGRGVCYLTFAPTAGSVYEFRLTNFTKTGTDAVSFRCDVSGNLGSGIITSSTTTGDTSYLWTAPTTATYWFGFRVEAGSPDGAISLDNIDVFKLPDNSLIPVGFSNDFEDEYHAAGESADLHTMTNEESTLAVYPNNTTEYDAVEDAHKIIFVDHASGGYRYLNSIGMETGRKYRVSYYAKATGGSVTAQIVNDATTEKNETVSDAWELITATYIKKVGATFIKTLGMGTGEVSYIKDIEVIEIYPENPAYQNGGALWFDGASYLTGGDIHDVTTSGLTLATWINTGVTSGSNAIFVGKFPSDQARYYIGVDTNGKLVAFVRDDVSNTGLITSTLSVNDGLWHHVAFVFNRDIGAYLYIDGVVDATEETTEWTDIESLTSTGNFEIGGYNEANYYTGHIAEVQVNDYALTSSHIKKHFDDAKNWFFPKTYFVLNRDNFAQGFTSPVTTYSTRTFNWEDGALYECSFKAKGYSDNTDNVDVSIYTETGSIIPYQDVGTDETWHTYTEYYKGKGDSQLRINCGSNAHVAIDYVKIKKLDTAEITTFVEDFSPNLYSGLMMSGMEDNQIAHPYAFAYNGTDQYINFGTDNYLGTDDFMMGGWIYIVDPDAINVVISKYDDLSERWYLYSQNQDILAGFELNNVPSDTSTSYNPITAGWHFYAVAVKRDVNTYLYLNGVEVSSYNSQEVVSSSDSDVLNTAEIHLGESNSNYLNGKIGDVFLSVFDGNGGRPDHLPINYENWIRRFYNYTKFKYI